MTTSNIKNTLIESVQKMKGTDVKKIYGLMLEYDFNDSLFQSFEDIPPDHKVLIKQGFSDLKNGNKKNADSFIKKLKVKYA